jgi:hypothetical protein
MATRVYFPSGSSSADVTPTVSSNWTSSIGINFYGQILLSDFPRTFTTVANTSNVTINNSSSTASQAFGYYVSAPLAAQTFAGNIKGQFRFSISSPTGCTCIPKLVITVVDPLGAIRTTLFDSGSSGGGSSITATATNRNCSVSLALTGFTCNTGDRLCFEIGVIRTAGTTSRTGQFTNGHANTSDFPEDNTTTNAFNGWVEFSGGIIWNHGITSF